MAYSRVGWEDSPSTATPLDADNLIHMEDGIAANDTAITNLQTETSGLSTNKMNKANPTGTGTVSINRKTGTTVGQRSVSLVNSEASGIDSVAIGRDAKATAQFAQAYGVGAEATAQGATALGRTAKASASGAVAVGVGVLASSAKQTAMGSFNEEDTSGTFLRITGNGTDSDTRSNAETLDWSGNLTVSGNMTDGLGNVLSNKMDTDDALAMLPADSASGNPCVITDAFGGACKSIKLTLEPKQSGSGTPSPINVRPISGRTQSTITRIGKNIFDGVLDNTGAYINADGTITPIEGFGIAFIEVKGGSTITVSSAHTMGNAPGIAWHDKNYNYGGVAWENRTQVTFTLPDDAIYLEVSCYIPYVNELQVEYGSTATPYEAYNGTSITIQLGQTVYGGVLDVTSGVLTIDKAIVNLGTLNYSRNPTYSIFASGDLASVLKRGGKVICSNYATSNLQYTQIPDKSISTNTDNFSQNNLFLIRDTAYSDTTAFKTAMNGVQLCYELATPTTVQLTPTQITLLHGDNVLTTDANNIEVEYPADIALYIAKKIAEGVSQGTRSLSKGGSSESTEEVKKEIKEEAKKEIKEEIKEEETKEEIKEEEPTEMNER